MGNGSGVIFVQNIAFFVQMAYTIIINKKGMVIWLLLQRTSASAWIQI